MEMLDDNQIESILRRYRPRGLPARAPHVSRRFAIWKLAIAAMLAVSLGLNLAACYITNQISVILADRQSRWTPAAEETAQLLDGNGWGRRYLAFALEVEERARFSQSATRSIGHIDMGDLR